jgi:hypothetical protein
VVGRGAARFGRLAATVLALGLAMTGSAAAATPRAQLAEQGCRALRRAVMEMPGAPGPGLLLSYPVPPGSGPPPTPSLQSVAFVYDNALAVVALVACGEGAAARRIADALVLAAADRGTQGAIRNGYRAGPVAAGAGPDLGGWWDQQAGQWFQDAYQAGTATGNVAWAALALLTAADATGDARYGQCAATLMRWVEEHAWDAAAPLGFSGGVFGLDAAQTRQTWKSAEHNLDAAAAFAWLGRDGDRRWARSQRNAEDFVASMWDASAGRFFIGTGPDGRTPNTGLAAIDGEVWPMLVLPAGSPHPLEALAYVRANFAVEGGYGFRERPDGMWTEGTAQAALSFAASGAPERELDGLFARLLSQTAPGGYLYATPDAKIRTGLAVGPNSVTDDFYYYHLPHLGATAWAVLAAERWNPFTGRRLPG